MADVPPDIAISSAQAGFKAREVGKEREARRAGQVQASSRQVKSLDEATSVVDTTDGDTAVFTDSEGTGSQGRTTEQEQEAQDQSGGNQDSQDDQPHLDIQA